MYTLSGTLTINQTGTSKSVKKGEDFLYLNGKVLYVNADSDLQTVWRSGSTMNTRELGTTVQGPLKEFGSYAMTGSGYLEMGCGQP